MRRSNAHFAPLQPPPVQHICGTRGKQVFREVGQQPAPPGQVNVVEIDLRNNNISGFIIDYRDPMHMVHTHQLDGLLKLAGLRGSDEGRGHPSGGQHEKQMQVDTNPLPQLSDLPLLVSAIFTNNRITGLSREIDWRFLPRLSSLDLGDNIVADPAFMEGMYNLPALEQFQIRRNLLTGSIPKYSFASPACLDTDAANETCVTASSLAVIDMRDNFLSGSLPESISLLQSLLVLQLGNNTVDTVGAFSMPPSLRSA